MHYFLPNGVSIFSFMSLDNVNVRIDSLVVMLSRRAGMSDRADGGHVGRGGRARLSRLGLFLLLDDDEGDDADDGDEDGDADDNADNGTGPNDRIQIVHLDRVVGRAHLVLNSQHELNVLVAVLQLRDDQAGRVINTIVIL